MTHRERLVIYGLLAAVLLVNAAALLGDQPGTVAVAAPGSSDLGPVDALVLAGADGELALRNREGRLSWGDEPSDRAYSVAYVFLGKIMQQLMNREELTQERDARREELGEEEREWQEKLADLEKQGEGLDPESEELPRLFEQWQLVQEQYRAWQQETMSRLGKIEARYLEQSYRELVEAVNVVAERRGIDMVYQVTPPEAPFEAENPGQAMSTIRMRLAMRYPEELDVTDYVLEEMGLEIE